MATKPAINREDNGDCFKGCEFVNFKCMFNKAPTLPIVGFLFLIALAGFPATAPAESLDSDPSAIQFRETIDTLISDDCHNGRGGLKFYSLDKKQVLYEKNSHALFSPASNMKMVTSVAALKKVGPGYRFHTRVHTDGRIANRVLKGNLYLQGLGDPSLVTEHMWILVNEIKNLPLTRVEGDIIADSSFFEDQGRLKTWSRYDGPEAYLAPLGALSFNFNTVTVHIEPGQRVGDPPLVIVDPEIDFIRINNTAVTTKKRKRRGRLIVNRRAHENYNEVTVSGNLPIHMARKKYYLNITDPERYTAQAFKKFLQQAGVEVTGSIRRGRVPESATLRVDHESPPLGEILRGLNKFSNNFVAEQILRTLGAKFFGRPGTTPNGVRVLEEYMDTLGYSADQYTIVDGSGLSRQNRLSPDQIVRMLEDARNDLGIFPEFVSALGVMGLDGSVEDRMNGNKNAQRIRVKTGTLDQVSALSGYFQSQDGEWFAFSILLNDLKCSNGKAMALQDKIMEVALQFQRNSNAAGKQKIQTMGGSGEQN